MKRPLLFIILIGISIMGFKPLSEETDQGLLYSGSTLEITNFYPNPAIDYINIEFSIKTNREVKIRLFNILGNSVKEYNLDRHEQSGRFFIGDLNSGTYFYQLSVSGIPLATKKLIIRK